MSSTRGVLNGDLRSEQPLGFSYKVFEKNHRFEHDGERTYRCNELWRRITDKATRRRLSEERLVRNRGEVKYTLPVCAGDVRDRPAQC